MFYRPESGHGLPHNPWNAIVAPPPIGWISTRGRLGDNLAPYSFFNATAYVPPQVMFASTGQKRGRPGTKDTVAQIAETRITASSPTRSRWTAPHEAAKDRQGLYPQHRRFPA